MGQFSPVEVDIGEEEVAKGDEEEIESEVGLGHLK